MSPVVRQENDAERAVIEAIMVDTDISSADEAWAAIQGIVTAEDFLSPANQDVFRAIEAVHAAEVRIDSVAVWKELGARGRRGHFHDIGAFGEAYFGTDAHAANVQNHAETVAHAALQRRVVALCHRIAGEGCGPIVDVVDWASKAAHELEALAGGASVKGDFTAYADVIRRTEERRAEMRRSGRPMMRLPSGLRAYDARVALKPGQLVVVAASAGMGKTAFAGGLALHVANQSLWEPEERMAFPGEVPAVLFIALEMDNEEMADRFLCSQALVHKSRYDRGKLTGDEEDRVARAANDAPAMPLFMMDETSVSVVDVVRNVRQCAREAEKWEWPDARKGRLRLVVIDYLGLMDIEAGKNELLAKAYGKVVHRLKKLARKEGICIVLACQINRAPANRPDPRARLSDLRDSGEIEQHADIVTFLFREAAANAKSDMGNIAEANTLKQRNGQSPARSYVHWEGPSTRFLDLTSEEARKVMELKDAQ